MQTGAIRELVMKECKRPQNVPGPSFFEQHLAGSGGRGDRSYLHDLYFKDYPQAIA